VFCIFSVWFYCWNCTALWAALEAVEMCYIRK